MPGAAPSRWGSRVCIERKITYGFSYLTGSTILRDFGMTAAQKRKELHEDNDEGKAALTGGHDTVIISSSTNNIFIWLTEDSTTVRRRRTDIRVLELSERKDLNQAGDGLRATSSVIDHASRSLHLYGLQRQKPMLSRTGPQGSRAAPTVFQMFCI